MDPTIDPCRSMLAEREIHISSLVYQVAQCRVYRAFNTRLGRDVALKLIAYNNSVSPDKVMREVTIQAELTHPNVVQLISYFIYIGSSEEWIFAIEMEWQMADLLMDIGNRAKQKYPYTEEQLINFLYCVTHVLAEAQWKGIAHRDIKPANIFVSHGVYKVGDFGSALQSISANNMTTLIGTPMYLSPILRQALAEQRRAIYHNPFKSDVYSLGLTLLHMATLAPAFRLADLQAFVEEKVRGLQYSDWLKKVVSWMLQNEENDRPDFITLLSYFQSQWGQEVSYAQAVDVREEVNVPSDPLEVKYFPQSGDYSPPQASEPVVESKVAPPADQADSTSKEATHKCERCTETGGSKEMILMSEDGEKWYHSRCLEEHLNAEEAGKRSISEQAAPVLVSTAAAIIVGIIANLAL